MNPIYRFWIRITVFLLSTLWIAGCVTHRSHSNDRLELPGEKWRVPPEPIQDGNKTIYPRAVAPAKFTEDALKQLSDADVEATRRKLEIRYPKSVAALSEAGISLLLLDLEKVAALADADGNISLHNWLDVDHTPYSGDPEDAEKMGRGLVLAMTLIERKDLRLRDPGFAVFGRVIQKFWDIDDRTGKPSFARPWPLNGWLLYSPMRRCMTARRAHGEGFETSVWWRASTRKAMKEFEIG